MTTKDVFRIAALSAAFLLAAGCKTLAGGQNCSKPQAYENAEERPPLQVPPGLQGLDTRRAVNIPALNEPVVPRQPGDPCVDDPPRYSNADLAAPTNITLPAPQTARERRQQRREQRQQEKQKKAEEKKGQ
ncbi:MAG: hypothetical protein LBE59_02670 [Nevskiaceae bacterium]|jgi:uncharacterized lipoprotein|nr:hypothetical protein [Nevskiaceae bacterium]